MALLARFTISSEEAAHIDHPDSTTNFDGWHVVEVRENPDGTLTVYAQQRFGDE